MEILTFPTTMVDDFPYEVPISASVIAGEEVWLLKLPFAIFMFTLPLIVPS